MPGFVYQPLLWGLLLVGLPVLIHLINMLRHRRVPWAAMEFLLQSQRRHRTWILMTQLLLLLLRMALVAIIVLLMAQPLLTSRFGRLLGRTSTHHIVLLDDSFSMSERWADTGAFQRAVSAVRKIGEQAADQAQPQAFTLVRFSRVRRDDGQGDADWAVPRVGRDFRAALEKRLERFAPSGTAADPVGALAAAERIVHDHDDARQIVYLISDFRAGQWNNPREARRQLAKLEGTGCELRLIDCAESQRMNLAVTDLSTPAGTHAAGVPLPVEVAVHNFGITPARDVSVTIEEDGAPRPALRIAEIPAGETVRERFLVHFQDAGRHQLVASLPADAVAADNTRYLTLPVPADVPVLLIDEEEAADARAMSMALAPGGRVRTGIRPVIETPRYLSIHSLDEYRVVYLLNVGQLPRSAVAALDEFVRGGGGLCIYVGENTRAQTANEELYQQGRGLIPVPLAGPKQLPPDRLTRAPDLAHVADHPIFQVFAGQRNTLLETVGVDRYFGVAPEWKTEPDSDTRVLARLRGGDPLVIEKRLGEGRVIVFLTTAAPRWNNWGRNNPSYVVTLLETQAYLAGRVERDRRYRVGEPIRLSFPSGSYESQVRLMPPRKPAGDAEGDVAEEVIVADARTTPDGELSIELTDTDRAGFYRVQLRQRDGTVDLWPLAINVEAEEGDLARLGGEQLAERLAGIDYHYDQAAAMEYVLGEAAGYNLATVLLYIAAALLVLEQLLAWRASYHPPTGSSGSLRSGRTRMTGRGARAAAGMGATAATLTALLTLMPARVLAAGDDVMRTRLQFGRIESNADWILPVVAFVLAGLFVRLMYQRDAVELPRPLGWLLTGLRTLVFLGLLIVFLEPQWQMEQEQTVNSRVLVLADTSLSMGLADQPGTRKSSAEEPSAEELSADGPIGGQSRAESLAREIGQSHFLDQLRGTHDVGLFRFDECLYRDDRIDLGKGGAARSGASREDGGSGPLSVHGRHDGLDNAQLTEFLKPSGTETRLGQALAQLLHDEQAIPLAGVVLLSDGGQNIGIGPQPAVELARQANVPIFTVGVGSDRLPAGVRVADFLVPERAYPGDRYTVTGLIQAQRMAGQVVTLELSARPADQPDAAGELIERRDVTLGDEGEVLPVKFQLEPGAIGRRILSLRVKPPPADSIMDDNAREAEIEIVDRKTRVLLFAGGPTREYRFLRSLLYRDRTVTLDVLLQSAPEGVAQEADKIVDHFPDSREEMFAYDCVIAFDPDFHALSLKQIDLLENWVAEQGGGLVFVAGPVYAGRSINSWTQDPAMEKLRALMPVEFQRRFSTLEGTAYRSSSPWPLEFTRKGTEAEFLWIDETELESRATWQDFPGVYGYTPLRGAKDGATVLARFSDPQTAVGGQQPPYFAWHFYASGRVFYMGSGEMWRLRAVGQRHFDQFYIKLIRHVAKGRLLRGSNRGVLLVDRERYLLGDTVEVQAYRLKDANLAPLEVPEVGLEVLMPSSQPGRSGSVRRISLLADSARPGSYIGQFTPTAEGDYRLELSLPGGDEQLTRRIKVRLPQLENENPVRSALLSQIAQQTGGRYYPLAHEALFREAEHPLAAQLEDRTRTTVIPIAMSHEWQQWWMGVMMYTLCGLLCLEWLLRRLFRLA